MTKKTRRAKARRALLALSLVLVMMLVAVGGTIAWLTADTDPLTNTFTTSNINITLDESDDLDLQMVPGKTIEKDPVATVLGGSEACYLFVKIEEANNFSDYMSYEMAAGWSELPGVAGVYYRMVDASDADQPFAILKDDQVIVSGDVTKDMMDDIDVEGAAQPTLTFTAYAVQKANGDTIFTPAEAWAKVPTTAVP